MNIAQTYMEMYSDQIQDKAKEEQSFSGAA